MSVLALSGLSSADSTARELPPIVRDCDLARVYAEGQQASSLAGDKIVAAIDSYYRARAESFSRGVPLDTGFATTRTLSPTFCDYELGRVQYTLLWLGSYWHAVRGLQTDSGCGRDHHS